MNSSPEKWLVVWKVEGFRKDQAEDLQRGLARETEADSAATDCSRVLRLPSFYNHKYAQKHWIDLQALSRDVYGSERFPKFPQDVRSARMVDGHHARSASAGRGGISQSERDWAYAKRVPARGHPEDSIIAAIAVYCRFDKYNPQAYADLTVRKAAESLRADARGDAPER